MSFQSPGTFLRGKHLMRHFAQGTDKGKYLTGWHQCITSSLVVLFREVNQSRGAYIFIFYPNQNKSTFTKIGKSAFYLKHAFGKLTACVRVMQWTALKVCRTSIRKSTQISVRASVLVKLFTCVRGRMVDIVDSLQDLNSWQHSDI